MPAFRLQKVCHPTITNASQNVQRNVGRIGEKTLTTEVSKISNLLSKFAEKFSPP